MTRILHFLMRHFGAFLALVFLADAAGVVGVMASGADQGALLLAMAWGGCVTACALWLAAEVKAYALAQRRRVVR